VAVTGAGFVGAAAPWTRAAGPLEMTDDGGTNFGRPGEGGDTPTGTCFE
jgi:hypothetical protein